MKKLPGVLDSLEVIYYILVTYNYSIKITKIKKMTHKQHGFLIYPISHYK
jgi:hypothetical protein